MRQAWRWRRQPSSSTADRGLRFDLIDGIEEFEPGRWIRAHKLTSRDEPYWDTAGSQPAMPPELVLESLCQAGQWLLTATTGVARRGALVSVGDAEFLDAVHPGDRLTLEASITRLDDEAAVIDGEARVGQRVVLRAEAVMAVLVAASELDDPAITRRRLEELIGTPV